MSTVRKWVLVLFVAAVVISSMVRCWLVMVTPFGDTESMEAPVDASLVAFWLELAASTGLGIMFRMTKWFIVGNAAVLLVSCLVALELFGECWAGYVSRTMVCLPIVFDSVWAMVAATLIAVAWRRHLARRAALGIPVI